MECICECVADDVGNLREKDLIKGLEKSPVVLESTGVAKPKKPAHPHKDAVNEY